MKLIQDLGVITHWKRKTKCGIFQCPKCKKEMVSSFTTIKNKKHDICSKCFLLERNTTHGMRHTKLYHCWLNMKNRVFNIKEKSYKHYGGRGITICEEWKNDFKSFYDWAITNGYEDHLTIDRIDNNGNYEPSNCRWTTQFIQTRNTRIRIDNKSGYRGVFYDIKNNFYQVNIMANKISKYLGSFKTIEKAAIAYDKYVVENNLEHNSNGLYKKDNQ